jgi:hypothetical protein
MIKIFEKFKEQRQIHDWLYAYDKNYDDNRYTISDIGLIDVVGDVDISERGLTEMPYKFNFVQGQFCCTWNNLISLKNAPDSGTNDFYYYDNSNLIKIGGCERWCGKASYGDNTPLGNFHKIFESEEFELIKNNSDLFDKLDVFSIVDGAPFFNGRDFVRFLMRVEPNYDYNLERIYDKLDVLLISGSY